MCNYTNYPKNYPCYRNKFGCFTCNYIQVGNYFQSTQTKRKFKIREYLNCKSTHVIYLVTCRNCKGQYVGETGKNLSIRFNKHRSDIQKGKRSTGLSKHFLDGNYCGCHNNYKIQIIDQITNRKKRRRKEYFWISELQTFQSNGGMNKCQRPPLCWYYLQGKCKFSDEICHFRH